MEYIDLAGPGSKASRIGLSACAMSPGILSQDQRQKSKETVIEALNKGINLINVGIMGECNLVEETIGRVISEYGSRANTIIVAKTGMAERNNDNGPVWEPVEISQLLESSLKRLRTDYIDILEISTAIGSSRFLEMVWKAERFLKDGKVRMLGLDDQLCGMSQTPAGSPVMRLMEFPYNLFEREAENEIIPQLHENKMVAMTNRSLCSGLLAGGIGHDTVFKHDDLRSYDPLFQPANLPRYLAAVKELDLLAAKRFSRKVVHLSIRWLLDRLKNSIVLWGARNPEHLDPVDEVMGWQIDGNTFERIDEILARTTVKNGNYGCCDPKLMEAQNDALQREGFPEGFQRALIEST